jgi:uncharacterized small protein (DUF1192 family)
MEYTITKSLSLLKTLKARYDKEIGNLECIAVKHGTKLRRPYSSYKPEDFKKNSLSQIQSVEALEKRIIEIKTKIDQANATTKVKIGGREMTIQEALVEKSFIGLKKMRLQEYKRQLMFAREEFDQAIEENKKRVEKIVQDKADKAAEEEVVKSVELAYPVEMIDASSLSERIKSLESEIEEFESNVDYALSEVNSITHIEVSD